jgi:hypothetical protein
MVVCTCVDCVRVWLTCVAGMAAKVPTVR